ncbi:GtrA family protein [Mesorhizobium sp. YM1C-6-2]|uniref:GtrA family protein n=1 Tax=Mesorhizobium sp. YM1C-6-2 TaxID=1827501 RepID=UPI001FDEA9E9|nr:GtrA family protein [Mesorhizobium sp. YM1C-6-2]
MASEMTMAGPRLGGESFWRGDVVKAIAATLVVAAVAAVGGFKDLAGNADNDSLLRLVEVRDLIAGQGWFDLHQYRMGAGGGGLLMHWSRLVDAPIAAIVLVVTSVTGSQAVGETVALIAWPFALYALSVYLLLRIGRLVGGEETMFPLLVIGATTLYYTGIFAPGALDHHNVQLVLMLAMVLFLLRAGLHSRSAWLAGVSAVLMLAVGMETVPYVAAGGIFVAGWFLVGGGEAAKAAAGFGAAFAATSAAVFVATVPSSEWAAAHCDAYSVAQFAIGALAGAGLAIVASTPALGATPARRAASLAVLGGAVAGLVLVYFPQCLGDPYAGLDPMLQSYWLDAVSEAQSLWRVLAAEPDAAVGQYATVLVALGLLARRMLVRGLRREEVLIAMVLVVALLVSVWQVRGSRFSLPLACVPLAVWVAGFRRHAESAPGTASSLKLVGAWLVSFHITWTLAASGILYLVSPSEAGKQSPEESCYERSDYAELAAMPAGNVLVISNLGAPMLRYTPHHVLAGPYHRNMAGNLAALEAFIGTPEKAREVAQANGIGLVAFCRGNTETDFLARRAPDGLLANLLAGRAPDWLEIVPESSGKPIELYRVLPPW